MSAAMVLLHRRLPAAERYPLPPSEITTKAIEQVTDPSDVQIETRSILTWLAHFAYGGAAGAFYAQLRPQSRNSSGLVFGVIVWLVSYLGLLPGLRVLKPASDHPARRNALMILVHLVWGWVLASLYEILAGDAARMNAAFHRSSRAHRDTQPSSREFLSRDLA